MALLVPFHRGTRSSPVCQLVFFFVRETREMCVLVVLDQFWKITPSQSWKSFFFFFSRNLRTQNKKSLLIDAVFQTRASVLILIILRLFFFRDHNGNKALKCFSFLNHTINFKWLNILLVYFFVVAFGMYFYFYLITYFMQYFFMYLNNFQETLQLQSNIFEINWGKIKRF